jgi:signal transduction histidine kinase
MLNCQAFDQMIDQVNQAQKAKEEATIAERTRLARELHDAVSQTLFSASLIADVLPRLWERNQDEGRRRLEEIRQLTRGALAEMRTLLFELRPAALAEVSFQDLLKQLAQAVIGRARIPVSLEVYGECELTPEVKLSLYRICQEALNNIAKHSGASRASILMHCRDGRIELRIADDGQGFELNSTRSGSLGLGIMKERANSIQLVLPLIVKKVKGPRFWSYGKIRRKRRPDDSIKSDSNFTGR